MVDDIATANSEATSRKRKRTPMKTDKSSDSPVGNGSSTSGSCGTESVVVQKGRKLKQYVLEEKLDIIDYAKIIGNRAAGREFNVAESSIREWRKNEQRLRSMFETAPERSRLDGGGRRPVSEDLEKGLLQFVTSRSDGEAALTWHDIKEKANDLWKEICERNPEYNDRGFTANMGWVARFVRRNNITLQVTNSASTITPKLVSSSSCGSTAADDLVAQTDANSTSNIPKKPTSTDVKAPDGCRDDAAAMEVTPISTTVPSATSTTTISSTCLVSTKKRRKNFIPKKVVANDIVCLTPANNCSSTTESTTDSITTAAAKGTL